jgi:hypothetical protein
MIYFFSNFSRRVMGPTHASIQWVPGVLSPKVNRSGCEADHVPLFSAEIKN